MSPCTTKALPFLLTSIFLASPLRARPAAQRAAAEPSGAQAPLAIDAAAASRFVRLALACVRKEYPNKLDHVMNGAPEVRSPKDLHPAFYGCFDWHSSVHAHWMMVRLLRKFPALAEAAEVRAALDESLAPGNVAAEVAYWRQPGRRSFERTYGWAWLLELAAELRRWDAPEARRWSTSLQPLTEAVIASFHSFLSLQTYPIRTGVHPNTAFSLSLALEYAEAAGDESLRALVVERARTYFARDRGAPLSWEPGGEDFLSPALEEAALMAKVLPVAERRRWLPAFLPALFRGAKLAPAIVSDRTDPKIVHLDGLNLSRARSLYTLAALDAQDPRAARLLAIADQHAHASLPHIASGSYEGEHWLATFAVQMLDARAAALER